MIFEMWDMKVWGWERWNGKGKDKNREDMWHGMEYAEWDVKSESWYMNSENWNVNSVDNFVDRLGIST